MNQALRGKCKEYAEKLVEEDSSLTLQRGHYICPIWGKQPHWWTTKPDGSIIDPTIDQFPKPHIGEYVPFTGDIICDNCGKTIPETEAYIDGNGHYGFCSIKCNMRFVGL